MRETIVKVRCDLCPKSKQTELTEADTFTLTFTHGGRTFETDLCQQHGKALIEHATVVAVAPISKIVATKQRKSTPSLVTDEQEKKRMRAWLLEQKTDGVRDLGRISKENQQKWIDAGKPGV